MSSQRKRKRTNERLFVFRLSAVHVLRFCFDNKSQLVACQDYPPFETPDPVKAMIIQSAAEYILILTAHTLIKHDFKTGSKTFHDLPEDLIDCKVRDTAAHSVRLMRG